MVVVSNSPASDSRLLPLGFPEYRNAVPQEGYSLQSHGFTSIKFKRLSQYQGAYVYSRNQ